MKRSGLNPPTLEQVRAWQSKPRKPLARASRSIERKTPLPRARKQIAKVGPKALREAGALARFRRQVKARAGGACEAPFGVYAPDGRWIHVDHDYSSHGHPGTQSHHLFPEDHDRGVHDPDRGLYLCDRSHRWSHLHPEDAKIARTLRPETMEEP